MSLGQTLKTWALSAIYSNPKGVVVAAIVSTIGVGTSALVPSGTAKTAPDLAASPPPKDPTNVPPTDSYSPLGTESHRSPAAVKSYDHGPDPLYDESGRTGETAVGRESSSASSPTEVAAPAASPLPGAILRARRGVAASQSLSTATASNTDNFFGRGGGVLPAATASDSSTSSSSSSSSTSSGTTSPGTPSALALAGATSFPAGTCTTLTISVTDSSGIATVPVSDVALTLGGASQGSFYSDASCTHSTTTVTLPTGSSGVPVYYLNFGQEALQLTITNAAYTTGILRTASIIGAGAISLSSGGLFTVRQGLLISGNLYMWGDNNGGGVGTGTNIPNLITSPTRISFAQKVTSVTVGYDFSCALLNDGTVQCWGINGNGQLGDGTTVNHFSPAPTLPLGQAATSIGAAAWSACALLADGTVKCWGINFFGQLGDGTTTNHSSPTATVALGQTAESISVGGDYTTCALLNDGSVKCWGNNLYGQLGDGTTTDRHSPTSTQALGQVATKVSVGGHHVCVLLAGGTIKCWGRNADGELGDGTTTERHSPTATVALGAAATDVIGGDQSTCALLTGGTVKCWGKNDKGQVGDGTTTSRSSPSTVHLNRAANALLTANGGTFCAILTDASLSCWGGALDGTTNNLASPGNSDSLPKRDGIVRFEWLYRLAKLLGGKYWSVEIRDGVELAVFRGYVAERYARHR